MNKELILSFEQSLDLIGGLYERPLIVDRFLFDGVIPDNDASINDYLFRLSELFFRTTHEKFFWKRLDFNRD